MIKKIAICCLFVALAAFAYGQTGWTKVSEKLVFNNPPFKNCHASTIVETQTGELLLACFGGSQEGKDDVVIWLGQLGANGEVVPHEVANGVVDDTKRFPCWNPVLLKKKSGELVLFYKVGPNPREWWGMYKTSLDNGLTWSDAMKLPEGILGPIKNKAVELKDGTILCPSSKEYANGHWRVFIERTNRKLSKWESVPVDTASNFDVIQPSIVFYGGKKLQILCRSKQGNVIQSRSNNNGISWSALSKTTLLNPNSGTDAVTLKDGKQLIVYNPDVPGKEWFNGRSNLRVAMSADGEHWQDIMELEHGTKEEFSYPAIIQTRDGLVHITYTYDRKNIKHVVLKEN
ncbi:exo-alpha-sialidase [Mucilaginibacter sp. RS28]|uniref:Exo-alpha-sialidase n=1 Tax=Mucilaginibacter straminoryzae TaxID=2932774 RepID=A0A9X1X241_9SPHI|nr:sialidase family protein [Mucilaginibacter straminoryzae]MCJ8209739.1 exo-alpha-sialidase [Mucilaginibacter straminoryzae]